MGRCPEERRQYESEDYMEVIRQGSDEEEDSDVEAPIVNLPLGAPP